MRTTTATGAALLALVILLVLPTGAAAAPPSVVTFDDLALNTQVSDQYQAAQRIEFGRPGRWVEGYSPLGPLCDPDAANHPTVVDGGITGRSGSLVCRADEIQTLFQTAFHTDIERRQVSFNLRGTKIDGEAKVEFFNAGTVGGPPSRITTQLIALPDNAVVPVSLTRTPEQTDLVTVVVSAVGKPFSSLEMDDLSMLRDDVPPPAKFSMSLGKPATDVVEGSSVDVPIDVQRYNGSSGAITFSVGALPPGIDGASVVPNPVSGTTGPTLRVAAASPLAGDRQLSVGASGAGSAGTFIGGGRVQTVRGVPAILAGDAGVVRPGAQTSIVSGCGGRIAEYPVTVRGGFSGPVGMEVRRVDGPVQVVDAFVSRTAAGDGTLVFPYALDQALGARGGSTLELTFRPSGATPVTASVRVLEEAFTISSVAGTTSPFAATASEFLPGAKFSSGARRDTDFVLKGNFPAGCNPNYLDDAGRPIAELSKVEDPAGGPDTLRVRLPKPETSTAVRAMGPGSVELARSARFTVSGYRNTPASQAANSGANAGTNQFTWGDFIAAFGTDDGESCSPFGCFRDPFALQSFDNIRDDLRANGGLCFGYSTMSMLFEDQLDEPGRFVSGLSGWQQPVFEGGAFKKEIVRWQITQYDGGWSDYTEELRDDVPSFAQFRQKLIDNLVNRDETLLTVRSGSSGHAVVAYDLQEQPNGTLNILTYNPNTPYAQTEETNTAAQRSAATRSLITVTPSGTWSGGIFNGPGGAAWTGNLSTIEVLERMPPLGADLPFGFWTMDLAGSAGIARVSSVEVNGTEAVAKDGSSIPGTGVTDIVRPAGDESPLDYRLTPGRSYDVTVTGLAQGTVGNGVLGRTSGARVDGLRTAKGQEDQVTLTPGRAELGLKPGGAASPATIALLQRVGTSGARMADVSLDARRGATETAALAGGAVSLRHVGPPTSASVELASVGNGVPGSVTTFPIRLRSGQRLSLAPSSWSDLSAGVRLTLRNAKGRVIRRGRARLRTTKVVRLAAARAKTTKAGVTVTGRVVKRGAAPLLVAAVEVLRGRKVVARKGASLRGDNVPRGAFSLPVAIKRPKGTKLRVTVSLVDEAAGFASVRKKLRAR